MAWLIVLAIVSLPVIEISLFAQSAEIIGVLPTLALAILAGMTGIALLRQQGLALLMAARSQFSHGEMPVAATFDALCLTVAGVMFILPGFLTDIFGILLLLPPVRAGLRWWFSQRLTQMQTRSGHVRPSPNRPHTGPAIIEGEFQVVDDDNHRQ